MPDHSTPEPDASAELLDLAAAYALHAVDDAERLAIESAVAAAEPAIRAEFNALVRGYRETMAVQSAATAVAPPARVLDAMLAAVQPPAAPIAAPISLADARRRRRNGWVAGISAAAAVVAITIAGVAVTQQRGAPEVSISAQVLDASDVRTAATTIPGGGTATVVFSETVNAAVLVMNDVAPPQPGTVYQMWLTGPDHEPVSMGTMDSESVAPSTQAVLSGIDSSTALGLSLEPAGGSAQPTNIIATIALT
ncbi:anti-sigma factor [Tomitella biformata]|uniref:anti-sigma factor n=1 Tax=Tomitella biformata TaxID=630403 RepID=UPI0004676457|nr:anti-sigma factor [Tomitella biformata]